MCSILLDPNRLVGEDCSAARRVRGGSEGAEELGSWGAGHQREFVEGCIPNLLRAELAVGLGRAHCRLYFEDGGEVGCKGPKAKGHPDGTAPGGRARRPDWMGTVAADCRHWTVLRRQRPGGVVGAAEGGAEGGCRALLWESRRAAAARRCGSRGARRSGERDAQTQSGGVREAGSRVRAWKREGSRRHVEGCRRPLFRFFRVEIIIIIIIKNRKIIN